MGCDLPASNDECVNALSLEDFDECSAEDELCLEQNNGGGTLNAEDPGFCCHPAGPGAQGVASVWYKFVATTASARIDTCSTTGAGDKADNSLIEVYKALDQSTPEDACATLVPLACNDDFPLCGPEGGNSRFDVFNLSPGQTHYIQLAAKTTGDTGKYRLRVTMPSPAAAPYPPPYNNYCAAAAPAASDGDTPFDLQNATMDCPFEPSLPGMEYDVWYSYFAATTDLVIVETCKPDDGSDPDTTLAVYEVGLLDPNPCPVLIGDRRASNDDAGGDCGTGSRVSFNATTSSLYKIRVGGQGGDEPSGMLTISHSPDCQPNGIPDACDISCGAPDGPCDVPGCGLAEDNNSNGIPDICEGCGDGPVAYVDPADGLWDARQPHPVDSTTPQGYSTFEVTAPERADAADGGCWQLCETNNNPDLHLGLAANSIVSVVDNGGGSYTITLDRPIAPGEVTTITYDNTGYGGVTTTTAVFSYLPADTDGDGTAAPADILAVIDSLNGVVPLPDSQVDMDRDGDPAPADILRVIDLLNGAGDFVIWLDAQIDPTGCP